jgi:hypothetical protein
MLDKESERFHTGLLSMHSRPKEYAVVAVTRKGIEVSVAAEGLTLEYSACWRGLLASLGSIDSLAEQRRQTQLRKVSGN